MTDPAGAPRIGAAWRRVRDRLQMAGIDNASLDARFLAEAAFGLDAVGLTLRENQPADAEALNRLDALAQRRLAREPVARILGTKEFYGLGFALSPQTLVPRPETELVVELALEALSDCARPRFADLGTGTGCIAIAILHNLPRAEALATDLDAGALAIARRNAERHGVAERLSLRQGAWFAPFGANESFEVILANPPYIARGEIETLGDEVRRYDPRLALDGGADGFDAYRVLARDSGRHLPKGGRVILEHGAGQWDVVSALFAAAGFVGLVRHRDLDGHDRVLGATWPG